MARFSTGPKVQQRSKQFFLALLDYANYDLPILELADSPQREAIELKWQTDTELLVKTKLSHLQALTAEANGGEAFSIAQIREALNRLQDCLGILKDHRVATRGSQIWHFSLYFWHPRYDRPANLQRFDTEWERYRQQGKQISQVSSTCRQDWEEEIDISRFYGRTEELNLLNQWILKDRCKVVTLLGMGGIGKTSVATKFAKQAQDQFDVICWRSLRNAPPLDSLLRELVAFISGQQELQGDLKGLLRGCQQNRCLLIFDNVETILQPEHLAGHYRAGYESYGELFRVMGTSKHQSCLVLTSREKPRDIAPLEGDESVNTLLLSGSLEASLGVIQAKGLQGTSAEQRSLSECYGHSPLALKIAAGSIQDLFDGKISLFLAERTIFFNGVRRLLNQQFERLSALEQSILYWLAINRGWTSITELMTDMTSTPAKPDLLEALESLAWRSLIERQSGQYTLQPVVMEYLTRQLIRQITTELTTLNLALFFRFALCKNTVLDYIRTSQIRLIVLPIAHQLQQHFGNLERLQAHFTAVLQSIQDEKSTDLDYSTGNLINLCIALNISLSNYDLSHLIIRQVNFQGLQLSQLNLSHATFHHCLFTQAFGGISAVAYRPDNQMLAVGDTEGTVRLWQTGRSEEDVIAFAQPYLSMDGHLGPIIAIAWNPTGQIIVTGSQDCRLKLWDAQTGDCLHTLLGHRKAVWDVVWHPNGTLISSSGDHTIKVWSSETGECLATLEGHQSLVYSLDLSSDGKTLVSGSEDRSIRFWDIQSRQCKKILPPAEARVRCVAWSPDGTLLASGSGDRAIRIWDGQTGDLIQTLSLPSIWINTLAWSPDGEILASGGYGIIQLWDPWTGECLRTLQGHEDQVWGLDWNSQGHTLVSGGHDQTIRFWSTERGQCRRVIRGYFGSIRNVDWSPDGQQLAHCSTDSTVRIWNVETGRCGVTLEGHTGWVFSVSWHPNQPIVASSGVDTTIQLWNTETGKWIRTLSGHVTWVWSVAWSPNGEMLASGSSTGDLTVRIWEVSTGDCVQILKGHRSWIWWVAWHPDGKHLATAGDDQQIIIWDVLSGERVQTLHDSHLLGCAIAWSPDGKWLASSGIKHTIKLWNLETERCEYELAGHEGVVWGLAWSPDGKCLASGGDDCALKLWDLKTNQCEQTFLGHENRIWDIAWCPFRNRLASGSRDGTVRVWDLNTMQCYRILRAERPYERVNIASVTGLTKAQRQGLTALGAVE